MGIIVRLLILFSLISSSAFATVEVVRFPSGTPVKVCQAADPDPSCGLSSGGAVTTGTQGQVAIYTSATTVGSSNLLTDTGVNVGIGTVVPATKLELDGTFYINATPSQQIMISPNGLCWVETIDNSGNLNVDTVTCPTPPTTPANNSLIFNGNLLQFNGSQLTF